MNETIAAYCAVLEFLAKEAQFGGKAVQNTLSEAVLSIEQDNNVSSIDDARRVTERILTQNLGAQKSRSVLEDIQALEQALNLSTGVYRTDDGDKPAITPRGELLGLVVKDISGALDEWRCFEFWAEQHNCFLGWPRYGNDFLRLPNTMKGIRKSGILSGYVKRGFLLRSNAYLRRKTYEQPGGGYVSYRVSIHRKQTTRISDSPSDKDCLMQVEVDFSSSAQYFILPSVGTSYVTDKWRERKNAAIPFDYAQYQPILLGLLTDLTSYARRVRQETAARRGRSD